MNEYIPLSGMTTVPSDFSCKDGQLFMSINVLAEGQGELHNLSSPQKVMDIPSGYDFLYVHETSYYRNFIFQQSSSDGSYSYYFVDANNNDATFKLLLEGSPYSCKNVNAIGNTLILFLDGEIRYFLFKNNAYSNLGNALPEIDLQFGLIGEPIFFSQTEGEERGRKLHFEFAYYPYDKNTIYKSEHFRQYLDLVMAPINLVIKDQVTDKGCFCFPFFVRYAFRLYDGTLVHHSAPILMHHSSHDGVFPFFREFSYDSGQKLTDAYIDIFLLRSQLTYKVLDKIDLKFVDKWKDIIKSVDIFISSPIYTYASDDITEDIAFKLFSKTTYYKSKFVGKLKQNCLNYDNVSGSYSNNYAAFPFKDIFNAAIKGSIDYNTPAESTVPVNIPFYTDEEMKKKIEDVSSFYLLKSLSLNELYNAYNKSAKSEDNIVNVEKDYLSSLVNREAMTDDYHTHDILNANVSYVYNKRLNIAQITRTLYDGYPLKSMYEKYEGSIACSYTGDRGEKIHFDSISLDNNTNAFTVTIEDSSKSIKTYTEGRTPIFISEDSRIPTYFFYPNTGLKEIVRWQNSQTIERLEAKMHDFLNLGFAAISTKTSADSSLSQSKGDTNKQVQETSDIYTSSVNNPFFFPSSGINEVGIGQVFSLASAVKALSEGQFGQFPLYAFTSNGVWALSVGSDGSYTAVNPVSRDVCISPSSICSLDSSVVFATQRGIMQLSGSTASCISDVLKDKFSLLSNDIDIRQLCNIAEVIEPSDIDFISFLTNSGITYDYPHQRIIVFNNNCPHCYVYSLQTHSWGLMQLDIIKSVNSYPNALVVMRNGLNTILSDITTDDNLMTGLVITRPFKINNAQVLCEINDLILRGNIDNFSHAYLVLYGTRDFRNYSLVTSSRNNEIFNIFGSPYKAFVLAIVSKIESNQSFCGISINYNPRMNNRQR